MLNGTWSLRIQHYMNSATVPATIDDGKITGDDGSHSYSGEIKLDGSNRMVAEINVKRHATGVGPSFNNLDEYTLSITGTATENSINGEGSIKGAQGNPYKLTATRAA